MRASDKRRTVFLRGERARAQADVSGPFFLCEQLANWSSVEFRGNCMMVPEGIHALIALGALERVHVKPIGAYTLSEIFELHQLQIQTAARAVIDSGNATLPVTLRASHF